jgi:hypothetical protein
MREFVRVTKEVSTTEFLQQEIWSYTTIWREYLVYSTRDHSMANKIFFIFQHWQGPLVVGLVRTDRVFEVLKEISWSLPFKMDAIYGQLA